MNTLPQLCFDFNPLRRCSKCRAEKPPTSFHKNSKLKDGVCSRCKQCVREYGQANSAKIIAQTRMWQQANPDKVLLYQKNYRESHPENLPKKVAANRKWRNSLTGTKKEAFNQKCEANRAKWRAALSPEEKVIYDRKRRGTVKPRKRGYRDPVMRSVHRCRYNALKKSAPGQFTKKEWVELCNSYGNKCLACGKTGIYLSPDHVVPLSRGGSNYLENMQPLCLPCNMSKNAKTIDYRTAAKEATQ